MSKEKSNIDNLRDILGKNEFESPLTKEALEFLDAIDEDQTDYEDEIRNLKSDISDKDSEIERLEEKVEELEEEELEGSVFLGLDTLHYRLENGNLKIQMQFEHWCEQVQKQNAVIPA
jgi:predicted RNase H-like nuclease (RuvC/YqgF family)